MTKILWVTFFCAVLRHACCQSCTTGCTCSGFDITGAFKYPYSIAGSSGKYTYSYSPCSTITCSTATPNQANMCQESIGKTPPTQFNAGASPVWAVTNSTYATITYTAKTDATRTTIVTIIRTSSVSSPTATIVTDGQSSTYVFTIYLPAGGSSSGDASGYVGFILISITIAAFIAYFVIGALIMYQFKGARGSEIIPNIGFWKDLPFLIKDGVLFVFSPCCGQRCSYTKM